MSNETRRQELHSQLKILLGSNNVYFQEPDSISMNYPAIVYERSDIKNMHADNVVYGSVCAYKIVVIDSDPTSEIVDKLSKQYPTIKYNRHFVYNKLNHDVFTLLY